MTGSYRWLRSPWTERTTNPVPAERTSKAENSSWASLRADRTKNAARTVSAPRSSPRQQLHSRTARIRCVRPERFDEQGSVSQRARCFLLLANELLPAAHILCGCSVFPPGAPTSMCSLIDDGEGRLLACVCPSFVEVAAARPIGKHDLVLPMNSDRPSCAVGFRARNSES